MTIRSTVAAATTLAGLLGLAACATPPDYSQEFVQINNRFDSLDARVGDAIARADAANQSAGAAAASAQQANQRIDQLQSAPPRSPRG